MAFGRLMGVVRPTVVVAAVVILAGCGGGQAQASGHRQTVRMGGHVFHLELALTPKARYQGLSGRKHIASDGGMLFVFPQSRVLTFVMRRCYVPIDLIYLDGNGRVVGTYHMHVQPYDTPESGLVPYSSIYPAQFAIELKGGMLNKLHLTAGETVHLPPKALKRRAQ